jgi:hypothetical protein
MSPQPRAGSEEADLVAELAHRRCGEQAAEVAVEQQAETGAISWHGVIVVD